MTRSCWPQNPLQDNLAGSGAGARRQAVNEAIDKHDMVQIPEHLRHPGNKYTGLSHVND